MKRYYGVIFALLLCCLALVFTSVAAISGHGATAGLDAAPATDGTDDLLSALEATVTQDMALGECGSQEAAHLRGLAREEPDRAKQLNFMAEHIEIYSQDAVKTALLGGDHIDFALELPFRAPDSSGLDATAAVVTGQIPYMSQYDSRWAYHAYGSSVIGVTGCGPTCLAMAVAGIKGDATINPAKMADFASKNGYYASGTGTMWSIFTEGAARFGVNGAEIPLDESVMRGCLDSGAVIVASMLPGDFTQSGHFIVIYGSESGGFRVHDPNSAGNSSALWSYERLAPQIANIWSLSH